MVGANDAARFLFPSSLPYAGVHGARCARSANSTFFLQAFDRV
jgi:hypothetical protein